MLRGSRSLPGVAVGRAVIVRFDGQARRSAGPSGRTRCDGRGAASPARRPARRAETLLRGHSAAAGGGNGVGARRDPRGPRPDRVRRNVPLRHRRADPRASASTRSGRWRTPRRSSARRLALADSSAMRERAADITDVARGDRAGSSPAAPTSRRASFRADRSSWPTSCRRRTRRASIRGACARSPSSGAARRRTPRSSRARSAFRRSSACRVSATPSRPIVRSSWTRTGERRGRRPLEGAPAPRTAARPGSAGAQPAAAGADRAAAVTQDGVRVIVRANLELPEEIPALERYHAEGVGLFRSEFLYLKAAPEARASRSSVRRTSGCSRQPAGHPVVVRTYDLGGEKGIGPARGENPALGLRGLRYCLAHPGPLRRAAHGPLPRGAERRSADPPSDGDVRAERCAPRAGISSGRGRRPDCPRPPALGVMIEVPSAALAADRLALESRLLLDRHERPRAVRAGGRPREPGRGRALSAAPSGDPADDPDRRRCGRAPRAARLGLRRAGRRSARHRGAARARDRGALRDARFDRTRQGADRSRSTPSARPRSSPSEALDASDADRGGRICSGGKS